MDNKILIENIRKLCQEHKVSISQLEKDLYMSPGLISRWSRNTPTLDRIVDIAEYFGVALDAIAPVGASSARSGKTTSQLLSFLYTQSIQADIEWDIFDIDHLPAELADRPTQIFEKMFNTDIFYCNIKKGYFFLTVKYIGQDTGLTLYVLADRYSFLEQACADSAKLSDLYTYLSKRYGRQLNAVKTNSYILSLIHDSCDVQPTYCSTKITDIPPAANN